jgi:type III secretory pathway component EscV
VKETIDILIRLPEFWTAALLVLQTLLFLFVPGFPVELWAAISALLVVVFGVLTGKSTVAEKRSRALARGVQ